MSQVIGWDIGGAHLKLAAFSAAGELRWVRVLPCALWQGLDQLDAAVGALEAAGLFADSRHAITMTGEMCDLFAARDAGVRAILGWFAVRFPGIPARVYGRQPAFLPLADARAEDVASMNWHASAAAVAAVRPDAVFVDVGSTTTDIIAIRAGRVVTVGQDDRTRLASDELVYQGVVRTPVMALAARVPYRGLTQSLAAEYFASTADVHRLTGELPVGADLQASADGRGKSRAESAARLARMVGDDCNAGTALALDVLAHHLADLQRARLAEALRRVAPSPRVLVVGAGIGRFLTRRIAATCGHPYLEFGDALDLPGPLRAGASDHAAAVAVARLGQVLPWQ